MISITELKSDEKGVTAIEYGIIALAMAALLTVAFGSSGFISHLSSGFSTISSKLATFTAAIP
ncbi:Flp family type IVb pilin [Vibrio mediterranei]